MSDNDQLSSMLSRASSRPSLAHLITSSTDEDMLPSMFARFPDSRETNSASWDTKMNFWRKVVLQAMLPPEKMPSSSSTSPTTIMESRYTFTASLVASKFAVNDLIPLGMDQVMLDLRRDGLIISTDEFLQCGLSRTWFDRLVKAPLKWSLFQLNLASSMPSDSGLQGAYVSMPRVEDDHRTISDISRACRSPLDSLMTIDSLSAHFNPPPTRLDMQIILQFAQARGTLAFDSQSGIIKLALNSSKIPIVISDLDKQMFIVKTTTERLRSQISEIEEHISQVSTLARNCIAAQQRHIALKHLQRKKTLDMLLTKKSKILTNLETIVFQLELAHDEVAALEAIRAGTAALKTVLPNISEVNEVMDQLSNVLSNQNEIDLSLSNEQISTVIDEDKLQAELDDLIAAGFPSVPETNPIKPSPSSESIATSKHTINDSQSDLSKISGVEALLIE